MKKQKKVAVGVMLVSVLVILFYDVVLFGGNLQFYAKWAQCGGRPYQTEMAPGHSIPWYTEGDLFAVMRTKKWYCTPIEAERDGFSANRYQQEFPHLKKEQQ